MRHGYTYPRNVSLNPTRKYTKGVGYFVKNDLAKGVKKNSLRLQFESPKYVKDTPNVSMKMCLSKI